MQKTKVHTHTGICVVEPWQHVVGGYSSRAFTVNKDGCSKSRADFK